MLEGEAIDARVVIDATTMQKSATAVDKRATPETHSMETSSADFHFVFDRKVGSGFDGADVVLASAAASSLTSVPM
jgi:hypothetical protein